MINSIKHEKIPGQKKFCPGNYHILYKYAGGKQNRTYSLAVHSNRAFQSIAGARCKGDNLNGMK